MSDEQAGLAYLRTFPDFEQGNVSAGTAFGLERILALLDEVGTPNLRLPVIHLAGTKGKGSTAAMLASIARAAGYRTGLFTQPHLLRIQERFQIDGRQIADEALGRIMLDEIRPAVERLGRRGITGIQQFEAQVALALLWFEEQDVDLVVLETGLGGRLDGTNVVPHPIATVLTPIGHDHMGVLGNTLHAIAGEKAAIIKQGVPAIAAPQPLEAAEVFVETSRQRRSPLLLGGRDWRQDAQRVSLQGTDLALHVDWATLIAQGLQPSPGWRDSVAGDRLTLSGLHTPLLGEHQAINAGTAAVATVVASARLPALDQGALRRGLASVVWPGRLQVVATAPWIVLDGAHTAESSAALAAAMHDLFGGRRLILVCGMQRDKDIPASVQPLAALAAAAVATRAHHPRAAQPDVVASALRAAGCPSVEERDQPLDALDRARELATPADVVLVTGSLYLVADVLAAYAEHGQAPAGGSSQA